MRSDRLRSRRLAFPLLSVWVFSVMAPQWRRRGLGPIRNDPEATLTRPTRVRPDGLTLCFPGAQSSAPGRRPVVPAPRQPTLSAPVAVHHADGVGVFPAVRVEDLAPVRGP